MNPIQLSRSVKILLISSFVFFVLQHGVDRFAGGHLLQVLGLVPNLFLSGQLWQIVTYSFLHADVLHLFFNLLMLAFIGSELEWKWGTQRFLKFYFFCVFVAGISYLGLSFLWAEYGALPMVGASGGLYGLLMAYGLIFGDRSMMFMMIFPMKAKHFIWLLALIEFMTSLSATRSSASQIAHLAGMAAGLVAIGLERKGFWLASRKNRINEPIIRKKNKNTHLRVVKDEDRDQPPKFWN